MMNDCGFCQYPFRRNSEVISFSPQKDGWTVDFHWLPRYCYLCSFLEGFEAYAGFKLTDVSPADE
jgi:hypothetical protein